MRAPFAILCLALLALATSYQLCTSSALPCLTCPAQCSACSDQSTCTACSSQYILALSTPTCQNCPDFCLTCNSSACVACMNPYVLVNGSCSLCVINQAASCSSTVAASACHLGYYLSDSYCKTCLLNCLACSSAYDCSACSQGYYLNSSIITCMPCPGNCAVCDQYSPSLCSRCNNNYLLQADHTCLQLACSVDNCDYCSAEGACAKCKQFYYWDGSGCQVGASVTCEGGAAGPLPNQCINSCSGFATANPTNATLFQCKSQPTLYTAPTQYTQRYYYAFNHQSQLAALSGSTSTLRLQSNGEYSFPLSAGSSLTLTLPNYYRLLILLKYAADSSAELTLTASTPTSTTLQTELHQIAAAAQPAGVTVSSSVVHSNNVGLKVSGEVRVVEMWVRAMRCAAGCQVCLNQQLCELCETPNYMLSYACQVNCAPYIHFLPNRTCLTACPSDYYQITSSGLKYCQSCSSPCQDCLNSTFCLSCQQGFFYLNYACSTSCPTGYYASAATRTCIPCISPCKSCLNQTACLSCAVGFWNGSICTNSCPSGQFGDTTTLACSACDSTCLTCLGSASSCTSCISSLLFHNGQCLTSCPARYFASNGSCSNCQPPCYTCSSALICLTCSYNYLLNSTCSPSCPRGYFPDQAVLTCTSCAPACSSCQSSASCTSCKSGCLYSGGCPSACPSLHFFSANTGGECVCQQCVYPCNTCSGDSACLSCVDGYLYGTSCLSQCPDTYYADSSAANCSSCSTAFPHCHSCLPTGCTLCESTHLLLSGNCLSVCPSLYYAEGQQCLTCVAPCLTCSGPSTCLTCLSPYFLYSGGCVIECPWGQLGVSISNSWQCADCISPCLSCSGSLSTCTYCQYGYYLHNGSCLTNCSTLLPINTFYGQTGSLSCQSCAFPCLTCSSQTACLSCRAGYLNALTATCSQCALGTYASGTLCVDCPSTCAICYSSSFCTACKVGYFLFNNTCISNSTICYNGGYFAAGRVCYPCLQPCLRCWVTASNCTSCLSGYIFYPPNSCLVSCPAGLFRSNSTCSACSSQCTTCTSQSDYCLTCAASYLLHLSDASCLPSCPAATYQAGTSCAACQYPCLTCSGEATCLTCISGVLVGTQCDSNCPSASYADTNLTCQPCSSSCKECAISPSNCTQCPSGKWLLGGDCLASCPSAYFGEAQSQQCLQCIGVCMECVSYINCSSCSAALIFFRSSSGLGECLISCPATYYLSNATCLPCGSVCLTCDSPSSCLTCRGTQVMLTGGCVDSCPGGMYSAAGSCQNCSFPCSNCTDAYTCTSCPTDYLLVGSSSCLPGPTCPVGYYLFGGRCDSKCPAGYYNLPNRTCSSLSCGDQLLMGADMHCYTSCPSGYLANQTLHCVACVDCSNGLFFTLSYRIIRDDLYLYLLFTQIPNYRVSPTLILTPALPYRSLEYPDLLVGDRLMLTGPGSSNLTFILPLSHSVSEVDLQVTFSSSLSTFANPLQKATATIFLPGYDYYSTSLPSLSSIGLLALFCALIGLVKNPFMVDYAQVLFFLGLLDCHYPRHLASFLESTDIAHLHGLVSISQGNLGQGKFMYLTGTGFLANTLANLLLIGCLLLLSGVLWGVKWAMERKMRYSRVHEESHQQTLSEQAKTQPPCLIGVLDSCLSNYKIRWLNRIVYFNFSVLSLFALSQLTDFSTSNSIDILSGLLAIAALVLCLIFAASLRNDKPKYTFLMSRKLLIAGAVVLSIQDAIYAVGIISVCNLTAALLIMTYKMQKYRAQTRFLAICQLLQLLGMACLSFFIMLGEGNSTSTKELLCWLIVGLMITVLALYLLHSLMDFGIYLYQVRKDVDLRENWVLNQREDSTDSHHSESLPPSMKDHSNHSKDKQGELDQQNTHHLETLLVQVKEDMKDQLHKSHLPPPPPTNSKVFWAYSQSEQGDQPEHDKPPPQMLVRCVNEFSDYGEDLPAEPK